MRRCKKEAILERFTFFFTQLKVVNIFKNFQISSFKLQILVNAFCYKKIKKKLKYFIIKRTLRIIIRIIRDYAHTNLSKDWLNVKTYYVINYELLFMKRYEKSDETRHEKCK